MLLNRTRFGQAVFAIGGSEDAAELMGLPVARVQSRRLHRSAALLAGVGRRARRRAPVSPGLTTIGGGLELEAIAAVVIGGTLLTGGAGTLSGTARGRAAARVIQNLINQVGTLTVVLPAGGQRDVPRRRGPRPAAAGPRRRA